MDPVDRAPHLPLHLSLMQDLPADAAGHRSTPPPPKLALPPHRHPNASVSPSAALLAGCVHRGPLLLNLPTAPPLGHQRAASHRAIAPAASAVTTRGTCVGASRAWAAWLCFGQRAGPTVPGRPSTVHIFYFVFFLPFIFYYNPKNSYKFRK
jgi:hypothetical protein